MSKTSFPGVSHPVWESISGGPRILRDGALVFEGEIEGFPKSVRSYLQRAHPRTAAAVDAAGTTLYLLVSEGRPGGLSASGAACILRDAGATDAMLLDGGGSAVMLLFGVIVNRSHARRKRTSRQVANALAVVAVERTVVQHNEVR